MHSVPWSHYEVMLAVRGEAPLPKMAYLEGELELMSPSLDHELIKSLLGQIVESFAAEWGIDLWPVGSWTIRHAPSARGAEPDECYTLGDPHARNVPDLVIEVVWTSGGIDKLEIYRGLRVPEVWFWKDGQISVFVLGEKAYERSERSHLLPALDLSLVARLATTSPVEATRELRAWMREQRR